MIKPKQGLHSFTRLYQAKNAPLPARAGVFGNFAAGLANADVIHETDAAALQAVQTQYSISTIEELAGLARIDARHNTTLLQNMGLAPGIGARVTSKMEELPEGKALALNFDRYDKIQYTLGCDLDFSKPPPRQPLLKPVTVMGVTFGSAPGAAPPAGGPPIPPATSEVSLIDTFMPPVRNQENRGTCVAFTSVACLEYYRGRFCNQAGLNLSEQYLFWNMVTATHQRNLVSGFPLLNSSGTCREQSWPYYGNEIPPEDDQGPAPDGGRLEAPAYACRTIRQLPDPRSVEDIQQELSANRIVGIGIPVYVSWFYNPVVRQYGNINAPIPGEVPMPIGHAVALVGYADDPDFAGGGYFIVRNSWGATWATMGVYGAGYGTIPYRYIRDFNWDAWCITA